MQFGLQQAVEVDHHIAHFGIVHRALRAAAPGIFGARIVRVDADKVDCAEIGKFKVLRVLDPPAHDEVQFLHGWLVRFLGEAARHWQNREERASP